MHWMKVSISKNRDADCPKLIHSVFRVYIQRGLNKKHPTPPLCINTYHEAIGSEEESCVGEENIGSLGNNHRVAYEEEDR